MTPVFPAPWAVCRGPAGAAPLVVLKLTPTHISRVPRVDLSYCFLCAYTGGLPVTSDASSLRPNSRCSSSTGFPPAVLLISDTRVSTHQPSVGLPSFSSPSPLASRFLPFLLEATLLSVSIFVHDNSMFFLVVTPCVPLGDNIFSKTIFLCHSPSPKH